MNSKMKWLIAGAVAGLMVVAIAIPALAAGPNTSRGASVATTLPADYGNCQGLGLGPDQAVAALLKLTQEQIREQRQAGKSLVQIASAQNVTEADLVDAIMAANKAALQNLVSAGTMTQQQADLRLAQMEDRVKLAVKRTTVGPPAWAGANSNGLSGQGMMRQGGKKGNQVNCTGIGQMMRSGRTAR